MTVLGVIPSSKDVLMAILDGVRNVPSQVSLAPNVRKQKTVVDGKSESQALYDLYEIVHSFIETYKIDKVVILQAGGNKYNNKSSVRMKTEAVFQIAAQSRGILVDFIHPKSLSNVSKDFECLLATSPEAVLNDGKAFLPKGLREAIIAAWSGLGNE